MNLDKQLQVDSSPQSPMWQLTIARVRDFYREPAAIFWVYGFPLVLAVALGTAFRDRPIERIPVIVVADSPNPNVDTEKILKSLGMDARLEVTLADSAKASRDLATGKASLLVIPKGEKPILRAEKNRPESAMALGIVEAALLRARVGETHQGKEEAEPDIQVETVAEVGGRYIDFLIPGLLGMNLMGGGLWGLGYVTVDLRVRKLLKRLVATPMSKIHFLLSLVLGRMGFLLLEIILLLGFAWLVFGVRIQGGLLPLAAAIMLGACCFQAIGLLVASRATSYEAVSGLMNLTMLPMYVLSGVFFSSDRFPLLIQPLIKLLPLTALNDSLRGVINEGQGITDISGNLIILAIWTLAAFFMAMKLFRWR